MTDKQPEALIRAEELEQIGAESSLARAMAAHTIRLLYKENEALRTRLSQCERCGEVNPAEIHTCSPQREWVGLTDDEILEEYRQSYGDDGDLTDVYFARAIETKLKEKNA